MYDYYDWKTVQQLMITDTDEWKEEKSPHIKKKSKSKTKIYDYDDYKEDNDDDDDEEKIDTSPNEAKRLKVSKLSISWLVACSDREFVFCVTPTPGIFYYISLNFYKLSTIIVYCYKLLGTHEDHQYCVPILATLIEEQYRHCVKPKTEINVLRSDGMEKNKNIAIKIIQLLKEKYPYGRINSAHADNYVLENLLTKIRVCETFL